MCLLAFRRSPFKLAINVPGVLLAVPLMEKHSTVGTENMLGRFVDSVRPALHIYRRFLLFHSTNGNSCCRGNTSSLWRIWGKEKPKEWHPAVFWAVVCGLRELPVTMGRRFTGHTGLCRKPLSWQTIYLAVCRRACGRWNLWYLLAHKLWFRRQGSDCFVCVCVCLLFCKQVLFVGDVCHSKTVRLNSRKTESWTVSLKGLFSSRTSCKH